MALTTKPYKGTRDFYPEEMRERRWMFGKLRTVTESFGYQEYDGPMLEPFDLYAAKTGEEIVNNQLFWLMDQGERKLAVRPEMTPTLARMVAGRLNELAKPIRLYSIPNLWRYERPQRGRLREHWQLNVDVLGGESVLADAEILKVASEIMGAFGGRDKVEIHVNNRRLMDHFFGKVLKLKGDAAHKVAKLVDARAKMKPEAYAEGLKDAGLGADQGKRLEAFFKASFEETAKEIPSEGVDELKKLFEVLNSPAYQGAPVKFDPSIMRGLDYYTGTVFEIYDTSPENRRAMFGGGRYDNLIGLFGKQQISGIGFGMGDVTLRNFLEIHGLLQEPAAAVDAFVTLPSEDLVGTCEKVASRLREAGLKAMTPLASGGFGAQLKQAVKHGAACAVLLGEEELKAGKVAVKVLNTGEQVVVPINDAAVVVRNAAGLKK